jgi:hypothetical protein
MDVNEPKKYIRTFAGDMEKIRKGETPDLTPLIEPKISLIPPSSPVPLPIEPSPPEPPPPPQPEVSEVATEKPSPIETYSSDFSEKMKATNASSITVLAAEQDAASGEPETPEPKQKSRSGILFSIAGVTLLIIGGLGVYFAYMYYLSGTAPVVSTQTISAPIFVDEREQISGTGPVLLKAVQQSMNKPLASGAVRLIYTTEATTTSSVFHALQEPAPDVLLRNINAEKSMAGIVSADGNQSPFFILSVTSYSNTFSGMLSWESSMPNDLSQLFLSYLDPVVATSTTATTTVATTTPKIPIATAGFRDEVVSNHDVRIYRDALGRSILLYGYWNQTTLIIAHKHNSNCLLLSRQ